MSEFTHFDERGRAVMVDVAGKDDTRRVAVASGRIRMLPDTLARILGGQA
ncbi:MAG TPA: cyclic pyranopterin monophosphate synthase MoaC, partial [Thiobacillus sp.]